MSKIRNKSFLAVIMIPFVMLLCRPVLGQDSGSVPPGPSQRPHISEIMEWLDKNGLAEARVGVRTSSQPAKEEFPGGPLQDPYPALSVFYAQGFKLVRGDVCNVVLRNDDTALLAHSKLIEDPPPGQRYSALLFIALDRLSVKKGKGPYRHTSNADRARLLGTWRTEFKSNRSKEDVSLTLSEPAHPSKLLVWQAETLTFTFDNKETSEKFDAAFREAIKICQPVDYLLR
jgi:hypothetical protein